MWIINNNEREFEREQENVASPGINEGGSVDRWWGTSDSKDEDYVVASLESDSSFHSNSSNMDITDEIITNHKQQGVKTKAGAEKGKTKDKGATQVQIGVEKRNKGATSAFVKGKGKKKIGIITGNNIEIGANVEYFTDSTHYADSEEETIAKSSTDEDEIGGHFLMRKLRWRTLNLNWDNSFYLQKSSEYSHNLRTCPVRAHDKANGYEKVLKTRTQKIRKYNIEEGSVADPQ
ncbi:hypothetical protein DCAR_0934176 [Daucus carota subsp. sativus]|uniref:Uncharacterized protein n=1 Tax=Daucus carota subsp. sativus TaxID=79200 RepID=A0A175YFU5_DAUCS|nr:hypothetical protein DCAR_0934176 [Daucus carota subsp. sativus]